METLQAQLLRLSEIHADPNNPRKDYPKESLKELAASMKSFGVQQPLKVRPNPKGKGYLVVFGHRRQRSAELAELLEVPCFVEEMDELKAAKLQLTENIAREDLAPLEVAGALKRQMDLGVTIEQLEVETGKKKTTLYSHMALLKLGPEGRKALGEETINASVAMVLSRVPAKLQAAALKRLVDRRNDEGRQPTYRETVDTITTEFMLELKKAPFDLKDAKLCPSAGACSTCPKNTGNAPDLFDFVKGPDVCSDKLCYDEKVSAHLAVLAKAGRQVLSAAQAKKVLPHWHDQPSYGSGYKEAAETSYAHGNKSYKSLVKPEDIVLAQSPSTGRLVELVPETAVPKPKGGGNANAYTAQEKKWREKRQLDNQVTSRVDAAMAKALSEKFTKPLTPEQWKALAVAAATAYNWRAPDVAKELGWESGWKSRELLKASTTVHQLFFFKVHDLDAQLAEALGVDEKAFQKKLRAEVVAEKKAKAKKAPSKKPAIAAKAKNTAKKAGKKRAA